MKARQVMKAKNRRKPAVKKAAVNRDRRNARMRIFFVRSWWVLRGVVFGALMLVVLYGVYIGTEKVVALPALSVKTIQVQGCRAIDTQSIIRMTGIQVGQPLLRMDLDAIRERVVRHPVVKDATVGRILPDTLRITVKERTPAAALMDGDFAIVDREGVVLSRQAVYTDDYPVITGIASIPGAGKVALEALPALDAMVELTTTGLMGADSISELNTSGENLLVSLTGSGTLLVLPRGDVRGAMMRLGRIVESGFFDTGAPGFDLRFKDRVVVMPERTVTGEG